MSRDGGTKFILTLSGPGGGGGGGGGEVPALISTIENFFAI